MIGAIVILAPCTIGIRAQGGDLKRLRDEVIRGKQELRRLEDRQAVGEHSLSDYRRKSARIDSALERLRIEERAAARELDSLQRERDSLSSVIERLRHELTLSSRMLVRGFLALPPTPTLLMPKEEAFAELRSRVVARWSSRGRDRIISLGRSMLMLSARDVSLRQRQSALAARVEERRGELAGILESTRNQAAALERNQAEREALARLVEEKNREVAQIASMVARSARQEKAVGAASAQQRRSTRSRNNGPVDERVDRLSVEEGKRSRAGQFRWPSASRQIVEGYGRRTNPRTGTVTMNPGINIGAPAGSPAIAAADGTVTLVFWLPRYGTVVIVEHADGWRTVYGNLSSSSVSRGTRVNAGQNIGPVGSSIDGDILHFEIWRGNSRVNPAAVLQ